MLTKAGAYLKAQLRKDLPQIHLYCCWLPLVPFKPVLFQPGFLAGYWPETILSYLGCGPPQHDYLPHQTWQRKEFASNRESRIFCNLIIDMEYLQSQDNIWIINNLRKRRRLHKAVLTQRWQWRTLFFFFFLSSLVESCCGEGGTLQTNNTGVCLHCLSHTGFAPAHGVCASPVYTAQASGCSAGSRPWVACTSQV